MAIFKTWQRAVTGMQSIADTHTHPTTIGPGARNCNFFGKHHLPKSCMPKKRRPLMIDDNGKEWLFSNKRLSNGDGLPNASFKL